MNSSLARHGSELHRTGRQGPDMVFVGVPMQTQVGRPPTHLGGASVSTMGTNSVTMLMTTHMS